MASESFLKAVEEKRVKDSILDTVLLLEKHCIRYLNDNLRFQFILKLNSGSTRIIEYSDNHSMEAREELGITYDLPERWFVVKPSNISATYYSIECFVDELYKLYQRDEFRVDMIERIIFESV